MNQTLEPATAAEMISRLHKITPDTPAQWGRMNAAQMMAHCQVPFHVYFGTVKLKQGLIGKLFGRMAKKKLLGDKPWSKNLPTAKEFVVAGQRELEAEKEKLIQLINRFATGSKNSANPVHPFFGKLSPAEWSTLAYRHLDHHLQQFSA
jgi:hypothetical protein